MIKLGVVMDPITQINIKKDTTFALMLAAQQRGWELYYIQIGDLYLEQQQPQANCHKIVLRDDPQQWVVTQQPITILLQELDVILMRKDPPFDMEYIYATYLLELAENNGCLVVNKPSSLRDCNEKFYTAWFPELCPETLITRNANLIRQFHESYQDIILKPLDGMGGASIFRITPSDKNLSVIIETLTQFGQRFCMAQRFIPEINAGDKRIILINGEAIPYALARIPKLGETRGNLAAGGQGVVQPLSDSDWEIAKKIGSTLRDKGLLLVGIDVIGNKLTEINVTSPTGLRQIEEAHPEISISNILFDHLTQYIATC